MPAYGDLAIIVTPKGKRSLRRIDENQDMHTQDGILRMADVEMCIRDSLYNGWYVLGRVGY